MAQPPRFQKKKRSGAPGFVDQVKEAMAQVQRELEAAQKASREAAGHVDAGVREAREGVRQVATSARAEVERLRKEELKQRLKAQLRERVEGKSAKQIAREARRAARETQERAASIAAPEGAPSPEAEGLEGAPLTVSVPAADAAPAVVAAAVERQDWREDLRRMLADPDRVRQAVVLHEILGPPKGSLL